MDGQNRFCWNCQRCSLVAKTTSYWKHTNWHKGITSPTSVCLSVRLQLPVHPSDWLSVCLSVNHTLMYWSASEDGIRLTRNTLVSSGDVIHSNIHTVVSMTSALHLPHATVTMTFIAIYQRSKDMHKLTDG